MAKQVRWKCETCDDGLLAPSRPRRNDVRRYCLPCSAKRGTLVERIAPALEKKREKRTALVQQKNKESRVRYKQKVQPYLERKKRAKQRQAIQSRHLGKANLPNIAIAAPASGRAFHCIDVLNI